MPEDIWDVLKSYTTQPDRQALGMPPTSSAPLPTVPGMSQISGYVPPPDPIYKPYGGLSEDEFIRAQTDQAMKTMRFGVENLAGAAGGGQGANEALIPRTENLGAFKQIMGENYANLPAEMPHQAKYETAFAQTRYPMKTQMTPPRNAEQTQLSFYPNLPGGAKGMYQAPTETTPPLMEVAHSDTVSRPGQMANTMLHEYGHARDDIVEQRENPQNEGSLFDLAGKIAKKDPSSWGNVKDWKDLSDYLSGKTIDKIRTMTNYTPEDFPRLLEKFKVPEADYPETGNPKNWSKGDRKEFGNPYEIASRQAGRTAGKAYQKFESLFTPDELSAFHNYLKSKSK